MGFLEAFAAFTTNMEGFNNLCQAQSFWPSSKIISATELFFTVFFFKTPPVDCKSNLQLRMSYLYQINSYVISLSTDQSKIYS